MLLPTFFSSRPPLREVLPTGGFRAIRDTYRTKDGRALFTFGFVANGDHYEIDILDQPSYGIRDDDQHSTHRLRSGRGGYRICLGNPRAASDLSAAYKWAAAWAENTWAYIHKGTPFKSH